MARRRRKSFGGSPAAHRRQARVTAGEFRHMVAVLRENMQRGECGRAFSRLKLLSRMEGEFIAERRAVSGSSFPRRGSITRQIEPLALKFLSKCVRT